MVQLRNRHRPKNFLFLQFRLLTALHQLRLLLIVIESSRVLEKILARFVYLYISEVKEITIFSIPLCSIPKTYISLLRQFQCLTNARSIYSIQLGSRNPEVLTPRNPWTLAWVQVVRTILGSESLNSQVVDLNPSQSFQLEQISRLTRVLFG